MSASRTTASERTAGVYLINFGDFADGTTPVTLVTFDYDALGRRVRSLNRFDSDIDDDSQSLRYFHDQSLRYFHDGQNIVSAGGHNPFRHVSGVVGDLMKMGNW